MNTVTQEEKIKLESNLEYLGLNLDQIPDFIKEYRPLSFRPIRGFVDNKSRIYKYIDIRDIQIYITPRNKSDMLSKKYEDSHPLYAYLRLETEEDITKNTIFLKMLDKLNINEINKIAEEQDLLNKEIPFEVKYSENYLWQIYYSDISKQYFMLVTLEDEEYDAFFYLLKEQIKAFKNNVAKYIYVPVCNTEYSGDLLTRNEISDTENYLWLFTKDWPFIYEVYDKEGNMSVHIVGNTICYEQIYSQYKIVISKEEDAIKFFKLLKALFILQTETNGMYNFNVMINKDSSLEFLYQKDVIKYEDLTKFIKNEFNNIDLKIDEIVENSNKYADKKIELEQVEKSKIEEFHNKEKEITLYLSCRKSFFGKIRFFMQNKKKIKLKNEEQEKVEENKEDKEKHEKILRKEDGIDRTKPFFTIEDLVLLVKSYQSQDKEFKNSEMDVRALENKIKVLDGKIKNATTYINEINEHNKSIFDFWKFTNKDNNLILGEIEKEEEESYVNLEKYFDYIEDIEDTGKMMDKKIRKVLSKKQCDSIFLVTTDILELINIVKLNEKLDEKELKILKDKLQDIKEKTTIVSSLFPQEDYDIFGGMSEDKTKIRVLAGRKHREIQKNKYRVIDVNKNTTIERFIEKLKKIVDDLERALNSISAPVNMSLYKLKNGLNESKFEVYHINPENAINESSKNSEMVYRINIKKGMPLIFLTNTIYYDNYNKTLPEGMEMNDLVLVDNSKFEFTKIKDSSFRINKKVNKFDYQNVEIKVKEYNLKLKKQKKEEKADDK